MKDVTTTDRTTDRTTDYHDFDPGPGGLNPAWEDEPVPTVLVADNHPSPEPPRLNMNRERMGLLRAIKAGKVERTVGSNNIVQRTNGFNRRVETKVRELIRAGYAADPAPGSIKFQILPDGEALLAGTA